MRRLAIAVVIWAAVITAHSQTCPPNGPFAKAFAEEMAEFQAKRPRTLDQFHDILRKVPEPHDAYLSVAGIGNETTVPLLLERYRIDYGATEPQLPSGVTPGFICTRVHLVDALRTITNSDQGMYYPRWAAWWDANKPFSQHQWVLKGFAAQGLYVAQPMDERFALELIEVMGRESGYRSFNARRLLAEEKPELRGEWLERAAASEERFQRLGAVRVLNQIDDTGHEDLLRRLVTDSDLEIRRAALTALNDRLRTSRADAASHIPVLCGRDGDSIDSLSFAGNLLIVAFNDGKVRGIDPVRLRVLWTRRGSPHLGDQLLVLGNQVVLASREGGLLSIDTRGRVLWRKEATGDKGDEIYRLAALGDDILVGRKNAIEQLDSKTGGRKSLIPAPDFRDVDSAQEFAFFVDSAGLHSLRDGAGPHPQVPHPLAVSVTRRSVCVVSGKPSDRLTCFAPDTLSLQWTQPAKRDTLGGHGNAIVQDDSRVYVPTNDDLTAYSISDGSTVWSTRGGQASSDCIVPTDTGLLIENTDLKLELRDPSTGEVCRFWPQISGVWRLAVHQHLAAVAGLRGELWVVDLRK